MHSLLGGTGKGPCAEAREIVRQRLQEPVERMKEMRRYRNELAKALSEWDATGNIAGHICGLIEGTEMEHRLSASKMVILKK